MFCPIVYSVKDTLGNTREYYPLKSEDFDVILKDLNSKNSTLDLIFQVKAQKENWENLNTSTLEKKPLFGVVKISTKPKQHTTSKKITGIFKAI